MGRLNSLALLGYQSRRIQSQLGADLVSLHTCCSIYNSMLYHDETMAIFSIEEEEEAFCGEGENEYILEKLKIVQ